MVKPMGAKEVGRYVAFQRADTAVGQGQIVIEPFDENCLQPSPNPVTLVHKDHFLTVEFHQLNEPVTKPYSGPYQGRDTISSQDIEHLMQARGMVYSEVLQTLSSLNRTVGVLAQKVDKLDDGIKSVKWFIGASFALFALIVAVVALIK